eukprot:SAG31_NODE_2594_length_5423_cov_4.097295_3_plen_97_part_00
MVLTSSSSSAAARSRAAARAAFSASRALSVRCVRTATDYDTSGVPVLNSGRRTGKRAQTRARARGRPRNQQPKGSAQRAAATQPGRTAAAHNGPGR